MKEYSRVTYAERCQISILLQTEISVCEIAKMLGRHKTTIYREIKRNSYKKIGFYSEPIYEGDRAHYTARRRFLDHCHRPLKVQGRLKKQVEGLLSMHWSPQLIAGRVQFETGIKLSHMSIYRYIKKNPNLRPLLLYKGRRYPRKSNPIGPKPTWWKNIHERPEECNKRTVVGHWERDLMYAKDRSPVLVCTDRKSRFTVMGRLNSSTSQVTQEKTAELLSNVPTPIASITNDQGSEFKSRIEIGCPVYFCDAGRPDQRGTIENTIGVIRRSIKQNTDLDEVDFSTLQNWLNYRPRKVLDYKTPYEVLFSTRVALVL